MAGGLLQLVASSNYEDMILTNNPDISFFKIVYRRSTNFSSEQINLDFNDDVDFGKICNCIIRKNGDLLHRLYVCLTIPTIITYFPKTKKEDLDKLFIEHKIFIVPNSLTSQVIFNYSDGIITVYTLLDMTNLDDYLTVIDIINEKLHPLINYQEMYNKLNELFIELINSNVEIKSFEQILRYIAYVLDVNYGIENINSFFYFIINELQLNNATPKKLFNYNLLLDYFTYGVILKEYDSNNILSQYIITNYDFNINSKSYFDISFKNNYILSSLLKYYNVISSIEFNDYINDTITYSSNELQGLSFSKIYKLINNKNNTKTIYSLQNLFSQKNIIPQQFCEFNHLYQKIFNDKSIPAKSIQTNLSNNINYHVYNNYYVIYNLIKTLLFSTPLLFTKIIQLSNFFMDNTILFNNYTENDSTIEKIHLIKTPIHINHFNSVLFIPSFIFNNSKKNISTVDPSENIFLLTNNILDIPYAVYSSGKIYNSYYNNVQNGTFYVNPPNNQPEDINISYDNITCKYENWSFNINSVGKYISYNVSSASIPPFVPPTNINAITYFTPLTPKISLSTSIVPPNNGTTFNIFDTNIFINYFDINVSEMEYILQSLTLYSYYSNETILKYLNKLDIKLDEMKPQYPHHNFLSRNKIPIIIDSNYENNFNNVLGQIKKIPFSNDLLTAVLSRIDIFKKKCSKMINDVITDLYYDKLFINTKIWIDNIIPVDITSTLPQIKSELFNINLNSVILETYQHFHDMHIRLINSITPQSPTVETEFLVMKPLIIQQYNRLYAIKYKKFLAKISSLLQQDILSFPYVNGYSSCSKFNILFKPAQFFDLDYIVKDFLELVDDIRYDVVKTIPPGFTTEHLLISGRFEMLLSFCEVKKLMKDYVYYTQLVIMKKFNENYPIKITDVQDFINIDINKHGLTETDYPFDTFKSHYFGEGWVGGIFYIINDPPHTGIINTNLKLTLLFEINYNFINIYNDLMNGILDSSFIDGTDINTIIYSDNVINSDILEAFNASENEPINSELFDQNNFGFILKNAGYETNTYIKTMTDNLDVNTNLDLDDRQFISSSTYNISDISSYLFNILSPNEINDFRSSENTFTLIPTIQLPGTIITINENFDTSPLIINTVPNIPLEHYIDYYRINKNILLGNEDIHYFNYISLSFINELNTIQFDYFIDIYIPILINGIIPSGSFLHNLFDVLNNYVFQANLYSLSIDVINTYNSFYLLKKPIIFDTISNIINEWKNNSGKLITLYVNNLLDNMLSDLFTISISPIEYNIVLSNTYMSLPGSLLEYNISALITSNSLFRDLELIFLQFNNFRVKNDYLSYLIYLLYLSFFNTDLFSTMLTTSTLNSSSIANNILLSFSQLIKQIDNAIINVEDLTFMTNIIIEREEFSRSAWIDRIGHFICEYQTIQIGDQIIDTIYSDYMNIWYELTHPIESRKTHNWMIGNLPELTTFNSEIKNKKLLLIPSYFWFSRNSGSSLPLISLHNQEVKLIIKIRNLEECIYKDPYSVYIDESIISLYDYTYGKPKIIDKNLLFSLPVNNYHTKPKLGKSYIMAEYIYLSQEERDYFIKNRHEYLIEQTERNVNNTNDVSLQFENKIKMPLNFSGCAKFIFFMIRMNKHINPKKRIILMDTSYKFEERQFNNYNLKSKYYPEKKTIKYGSLQFFGKQRINEYTSAEYLNYVQSYQCGFNTPPDGVYLYSFALYGNSDIPSGCCNMSKIDDCYLLLKLDDDITDINNGEINVYISKYNILRIMSGMSGLAFK